MLRRLIAVFCSLLLLGAQALHAAPVNFTYNWSASNLFDSNGNPPPNALHTTSGNFTLAFDPLANLSLVDLPILNTTSFTDNEGVTLGMGDIFYSVEVFTAVPERIYRISVGAIVSPLDTADSSVGSTNDVRLEFLVFGGTGSNVGQPTGLALPEDYTFSNGALGSIVGELSVSLAGPAVVPLPAGLPLLGGALAVTLLLRRRKSD